MVTYTDLIKVFIFQTQATLIVRCIDFKPISGLPGYMDLLYGIARQLEEERNADKIPSIEAVLIKALITAGQELPMCLKSKRKAIDPKVPKSFAEASHLPVRAAANDRVFNALVERGTWTYSKCETGMQPVPFDWVFKLNPLDNIEENFIEKAGCRVREIVKKPLSTTIRRKYTHLWPLITPFGCYLR